MSNEYVTKVTTLRTSIAHLHAERNTLLRQKNSRAEVIDRFDRLFDAAEARAHAVARLDAGRLMAGTSGDAALLALQGHHGQAYDSGTLQDVLAVVCAALGRRALRAIYAPALEALPAGLDKSKKPARLAKIAAELDKLEADEERMICEAAMSGIHIPRRIDARPEIVLSAASEGGSYD